MSFCIFHRDRKKWTLPSVILLATAGSIGSGSAAQTIDSTTVPFNDFAPRIQAGQVVERRLSCELQQAMNIDPTKDQSPDEIVYTGNYALQLVLPAKRLPYTAGTGTTDPDHVPDPAYRVVEDANSLFREFPATKFDRVADYWPKQVTLAQTVMGRAFQYINLEENPARPGTTTIFISRAADAVTLDLGWIYRGVCTIDHASDKAKGAKSR